jgi:hypothetical protein
VMGRSGATRGPHQREERGSGSGQDAETLPPRMTGGEHPGQTVESCIIHLSPPRLVRASSRRMC